jgi:hypothetical protein
MRSTNVGSSTDAFELLTHFNTRHLTELLLQKVGEHTQQFGYHTSIFRNPSFNCSSLTSCNKSIPSGQNVTLNGFANTSYTGVDFSIKLSISGLLATDKSHQEEMLTCWCPPIMDQ